jgi:serine/threonine protein kinase
MLEVAEGVRYMHSEGIVHGDLKGVSIFIYWISSSVHRFYQENILLDSDLHCQIVDFGLTRHSDATTTGDLAFSTGFVAPELFGKCTECSKYDCDGRRPGHAVQRKKTMETDVYAFGCLYYSVSLSFYQLARLIRFVQIFFNTVPFGGNSHHVSRSVINERRPGRLKTPKMEDDTWNLIENCWKLEALERPKMEQIVSFLTLAPAIGLSVPLDQPA